MLIEDKLLLTYELALKMLIQDENYEVCAMLHTAKVELENEMKTLCKVLYI